MYQETVKSILDKSDHPGISAEELELFKSQFRASAFTCRLKSCPRATLGFETIESRLEHESTHVRKIRCTFPHCNFPPFVSPQSLKIHVKKYHSRNLAPKSIKDIRTSSTPKRAPTRHDEEGEKPMQKRQKGNKDLDAPLGDDSDEASDNDDWDEELYHTIINLLELPVGFHNTLSGMPTTLKRWEDFWPWFRRQPEIPGYVDVFTDLQHSQFKDTLARDAQLPLGDTERPNYGVSYVEVERVQKNSRWCNASVTLIENAIIETKAIVWEVMKEN